MQDSLTQQYGHLLLDLLAHWRDEHPRRARGGWWALSGFSFQTSEFLFHFFKGLDSGSTEPGLLAEMEHLSDILSPSDRKLTLIQVKRTLTKSTLISALEEAYLITEICKRKTSSLLTHIRFQIACRHNSIDFNFSSMSMSDVVGENGDETIWQAMLACFDESTPIIEEPDPLDRLHIRVRALGFSFVT